MRSGCSFGFLLIWVQTWHGNSFLITGPVTGPLRFERMPCPLSSLHMAVTPVGPFCPFRSSSAQTFESRMEYLNAASPHFALELNTVQLDYKMGKNLDKERLLRAAEGMSESVDEWESIITRLRLSPDFQTREFAKFTQAHLEKHEVTVETVASMTRWQIEVVKSLAYDRPPPLPPANIDMDKMMEQISRTRENRPSLAAMSAAGSITTNPFTGNEAALDSPIVKEEYERLCRDHSSLIEFGANYESFDPLGKIAYLDEIEKVQERWDVFFTRFSLMGALNKDYIAQCNAFLASMGLKEEDYRKLLKECHDIMRRDAEQERNLVGL